MVFASLFAALALVPGDAPLPDEFKALVEKLSKEKPAAAAAHKAELELR